MQHGKMEFVKPHMIIGVDFGMTCTSHSRNDVEAGAYAYWNDFTVSD